MLQDFDSLISMVQVFNDEKTCVDHFRALRWPDGVVCPHCGAVGAYSLSNGTHKCAQAECAKKFSVRNGTIFEDSKISLQKWFMAIYLVTSHKKGISSHQLAKDIKVTQKTAWFMLQRIRNAAMTEEFNAPLSGNVEIDEAYVGGQAKWKHANKRKPLLVGHAAAKQKKIAFGMIERGGDLRLRHVPDTRLNTLRPIIQANVAPGSSVHTDEAQTYIWMRNEYVHRMVSHTLGEYVRDDVTTNRIEGVFSHFKRCIVGVYHKASDKHLDRYLQMFAWRWNRRHLGEGARVNNLLRSTQGRRLTHADLVAKGA